jgi:hypothetical protein
MPPWLKTRSTAELSAGTLKACIAGTNSLSSTVLFCFQNDCQSTPWPDTCSTNVSYLMECQCQLKACSSSKQEVLVGLVEEHDHGCHLAWS